MSANTQPIFPLTPTIGIATLTTPTAITTRTNIVGTTGLTPLTPPSTNGKRVDSIRIRCKATSVATNLCVWLYNGTTSHLIDEISIGVTTASNTSAAYVSETLYDNMVLPATYQLFVSVTVAQDMNVFCHGGDY